MALDEFEIIAKYFANDEVGFKDKNIVLGIGDDCALLAPTGEEQLAVSMDMLVEGVHFLEDADPFLLGQRTLLVNLSDLAAMGARPLCFTLGLSLPAVDEQWLAAFSAGLAVVAQANHCPLVGGDMTASHPQRGGRTFCVQVHGLLPQGQGIKRSGANAGDVIYVTGALGNAAAGLELLRDASQDAIISQNHEDVLKASFYQPSSRIEAGIALRGLATSAIDLSDGLASDLKHILRASGVGASVDVNALPISDALRAFKGGERGIVMALTGGDDYELCFTIASNNEAAMLERLSEIEVTPHRIGIIESDTGLRWLGNAAFENLNLNGYKHFN